MELSVDLAACAALVLAVEGTDAVLGRCLADVRRLPAPVRRLVAWVVLAGYAEVLLGLPWARPMPPPATVEALGVHPRLAAHGVALALLGGARALRRKQRRRRHAPQDAARHRARSAASWILYWPLLLAPCCWLPPWGIDASLYHLSLPLQRLLGHGAVPGHGNAGFFGLGEMAGVFGLGLGSLAAARTVQLWATVWATQAYVALVPGTRLRQALLAEALFVASPAVLWQLGGGYVDVWWSLLEGVGLLTLWRWHRAPAAAAAPARWVASALLVGGAAASKSLALVDVLAWVLAVASSVAARRRRGGGVGAFGGGVSRKHAVLAAAALTLPWAGYVARNLWRAHAPLYPFGGPLWPHPAQALSASQTAALQGFLALHGPQAHGVPLQGLAAVAALPWALTFRAGFSGPNFDGVLGPAPLAAACGLGGAALVAWVRRLGRGGARLPRPRRQTTLAAWAGALVALRLAVWLATSWQARFLFGPLWWACWALATWPGGRGRDGQVPGRWRWVPAAATLVATACFWPSLRGHLPRWDRRAFAAAPARQAARLASLPVTAACAAPWGEAPGGRRLLLVWTQRWLLWCPGWVHSDSYDEAATLDAALAAAAGPGGTQAAVQLLRTREVGSLLVDEAWLAYADPALTPPQRQALAQRQRAWRRFAAAALEVEAQIGSVVRYRVR